MESDANTLSSSPTFSHSSNTLSSSSPPQLVMTPCAACKILRRRCAEKCVLAPYFPPTEPAKFTTAHRVFGASNIIKFLQELPECQRADAVASMVYEAGARIRDPVYGSAGAICQLQKQVNELQAQLAKAQAEVVNMQFQQANLVALICMEMSQTPQESPQQSVDNFITSPSHSSGYQNNLSFFEDNTNLNSLWEPLWT
ncbi:LOB domain-containing protein 1-like [Vigna unguiculata]|uniref:Carbamoyl-phosphate synthase large subunit n=1 Tax=Vigna unguiculata TaxID=3917 RepID=A0A4D6N7Q6_VIGUN|nr:LOB domain-containing protein 1-like [Vigna unguiculata]QCE09308.1 carbamoyl-phosphate synthase large subunit [Vigna unguiculata]